MIVIVVMVVVLTHKIFNIETLHHGSAHLTIREVFQYITELLQAGLPHRFTAEVVVNQSLQLVALGDPLVFKLHVDGFNHRLTVCTQPSSMLTD
jgi:hypothetical protein